VDNWRNIAITLIGSRGSPPPQAQEGSWCNRLLSTVANRVISLCVISLIRQPHAAKQLLKTGIGVKLIEHWINFQVDHLLVMFLEGLL
jgi:hypothetical protein